MDLIDQTGPHQCAMESSAGVGSDAVDAESALHPLQGYQQIHPCGAHHEVRDVFSS